jgi:predicted RNase H-like HicB family nuclease
MRENIMEHIIKLTIEQHIENGESYYLATSSDVQGLVAEGRTLAETIEIAQDVAKLILQDKREEMAMLPTVPKKLDYSLVVDY